MDFNKITYSQQSIDSDIFRLNKIFLKPS